MKRDSTQNQTAFVYETFSCIARRYELFNALSSCGLYKLWLNALIKHCPCSPEARVLDLAAGTGDVSLALAQRWSPREIYCTDLVPSMLEIAQEKFKTRNTGGTNFIFDLVDAQNIPYENEGFDVVVMAYGIRNIPCRTQALQEIYRVLKTGGRFVCLEFSHPHNPLLNLAYTWYSTHVLPFWGKLLFGSDESVRYLVQSIKNFPCQEAFVTLICDVGFRQVQVINLSGGIVALHCACKE